MIEFEQLDNLDIELIDGDRGKNYPKPNEFFSSGECLFLSADNVTKNGFVFNNCSFISGEKDSLLRSGKLKRNDIVITTRGTVGNVCLFDKSIPFDNVRINSGMLIVRCGPDVDPFFLYLILSSEWFSNKIKEIQTGSAQPQLPKSILGKMEIPYPKKEKQTQLVDKLFPIVEKLKNNSLLRDNLYKQAKAYFTKLFEKDYSGFCQTNLGKVTRQNREKIGDKDLKVLSAVNTGRLVLSSDYFSKQVFSKDISKYILVPSGDFAYNPARINIGSIGLNDFGFDGCVSPVYVSFSVEKDYTSFFEFYFKSKPFKEETVMRSSGSVRQSLNYTDFAMIEIKYPPKQMAVQFRDFWLPRKELINNLEKEDIVLLSIENNILKMFISGE